VALRAADQVTDSAQRAELRVRVFWLYAAYGSGTSIAVMLEESRTPAERALVPERAIDFASSLGPVGEDSTRFLRIHELEASGQFRTAANHIYWFISQRSFRQMHGASVGPEWAVVDSLARRAASIARQVTESFADSINLRLVRALVGGWDATARDLAEAITDSTLRSSGMLIIARRTVESNPTQALEDASEIPSRVGRDSLLAVVALRFSDVLPDSAIALARRIGTPNIRGITLIDLAGRAATRGNELLAHTLVLEGMREIDAFAPLIDGTKLVALVRGGLYEEMLRWARGQQIAESRARVLFALYEAVTLAGPTR